MSLRGLLISFHLLDPGMADAEITPVVWDQFANNGFGIWRSDPCQVMWQSASLVKFNCTRIGYYGLKYDLANAGSKHVSIWHHPVLYFGCCVGGLLILLTLAIFASKFPMLRMALELKHVLVNLWACILILIYLYVMGIYQVDHEITCRIVSFALHNLTISSLLWILIGIYVIYYKISGGSKAAKLADGILIRNAHQEALHQHHKTLDYDKRPLIRAYFVAYGAPFLIVIITASVSLDHYSNGQFCFLSASKKSLAPLIGSLAAPCILATTVMTGFALSILCVLSGSPQKVTETASYPDKNPNLLDATKHPRRVLYNLLLQFILIAFIMVASGLQLSLEHFSTEFSAMTSVFAILYGAFIFATFCVFRPEVLGLGRQAKASQSLSPDHDEITANLVEMCPRPLPPTSMAATGSLRASENQIVYAPQIPSSVTNLHPKTSSPANSHIPQVQDMTISPLVAAANPDRTTEPYSVVPLAFKAPLPIVPSANNEMSLASVNTGLSYTDSSTIRMGVPCDMATFDMGQPTSASLIGTGTPKRLLQLGTNHSLPRSLRSNPMLRPKVLNPDDALETQSKFSALSVGSSRSGHSKSGKKRHKKPTRKRPRNKAQSKEAKEPVYNNLPEDEYLGDDDQFDTLERQRRTIVLPDELPSIIHEVEGDEDDLDPDLEEDDNALREEPASLDDLPPPSEDGFDLPKRETSV